VVGDVSFISLTLVLPAIAAQLKPGGRLLMLVKPQFELQPGQLGKGGLVKDPALYLGVRQRIEAACAEVGLVDGQWMDSPIEGGDGNREFFMGANRPDDGTQRS
jgi:23S rRNA (cytidine1920-2'-O)/16S rRNA (cytidine1409-2'-O)-methyltransferase